jgi:hypothetical protein
MSLDHTLRKLIENIDEYGTLLQFLFERHPTILVEFKNKNVYGGDHSGPQTHNSATIIGGEDTDTE